MRRSAMETQAARPADSPTGFFYWPIADNRIPDFMELATRIGLTPGSPWGDLTRDCHVGGRARPPGATAYDSPLSSEATAPRTVEARRGRSNVFDKGKLRENVGRKGAGPRQTGHWDQGESEGLRGRSAQDSRTAEGWWCGFVVVDRHCPSGPRTIRQKEG